MGCKAESRSSPQLETVCLGRRQHASTELMVGPVEGGLLGICAAVLDMPFVAKQKVDVWNLLLQVKLIQPLLCCSAFMHPYWLK